MNAKKAMAEKQALVNRERGIREASARMKVLDANKIKNEALLKTITGKLSTAPDKKAFMAMQE